MKLEWIQRLMGLSKLVLGIVIASGLVWRSQSYREGVSGYELLAPAMLTIAAVLILLTSLALSLGKSDEVEYEPEV